MSSQREERLPAVRELEAEEIAELLGDHVIGRDDHFNAPGFVIRPDEVQAALTILKEEAGFDHLSCLSAQQYEDRYESIYHLKKYADPTQEVSIVVPTPTDAPVSQTAEPVYRTAEWHEREAYDLVGIEYEGNPDLRRILLPEAWKGHPLSLEYDQDRPQIVTLEEHKNPITQDEYADNADTMFLNVGPHHPATHGVLHIETVLDGEQVLDARPDIGYLHRCEEQMAQNGKYRHEIMPYPDRWDYTANMTNEWAYARAAEDLADIDVPEYAQILRTLGVELSRMAGHFLAVGTFALDVYGDFTAIFQYAFRDREIVQNVLEDLTGQRMMFNYFRLGGVIWDVPEPRAGVLRQDAGLHRRPPVDAPGVSRPPHRQRDIPTALCRYRYPRTRSRKAVRRDGTGRSRIGHRLRPAPRRPVRLLRPTRLERRHRRRL